MPSAASAAAEAPQLDPAIRANQADAVLRIGPHLPTDLDVLLVEGEEALGRLFEFRVLVAVQAQLADNITEWTHVGEPAELTIINRAGGRRRIGALITACEFLGSSPHHAFLSLTLAPPLWPLSQRVNCRVFQGDTTWQVLERLLADHGLVRDVHYTCAITNPDSFEPRDFCVQYRESDWNFLSRLMEEEGIYFFQRERDAEQNAHHDSERGGDLVLHFTDGPVGHFDLPQSRQTRFHAPDGMTPEAGTVYSLSARRDVRPGKVLLVDYAAQRPSTPLRATAGRTDDGAEVFDYPGEFRERSLGERLARLRLEELRTGQTLTVGRSTRTDFAPGFRFQLVDHSMGRFNRDYTITAVRHRVVTPMAASISFAGAGDVAARLDTLARAGTLRGRGNAPFAHGLAGDAGLRSGVHPAHHASGFVPDDSPAGAGTGASGALAPAYDNAFEAIHADEPFRPARVTPRPRMAGPQTAIVVGPEKQADGNPEIYTESLGRVKVRFRWDRDEQLAHDRRDAGNASCWIRVSQPWAGPGMGNIAVPRVGQEVIVDFLEGDPDQPIITGRVHHGEDGKPPQSMASPLRMTGKGATPIAAMQNRAQALPGAKTRTTFRSQSSPGGGGANELSFDDGKGSELFFMNATKDAVRTVANNDTTTVGTNRDISVGANLDEYVAANRSRQVGANETVQVDANQDVTVDGNRSILVKGSETHTVNVCRAKQTMISENILTGVSKTVETGLVHLETVGLMHALIVGMQRVGVVGLDDDLMVGGDKSDTINGNLTMEVGSEMGVKAGAKLVIECPDITLAGKGGFIRIDGNGVTIKGTPVKINCAGAEAGKLSDDSAVAAGGAAGGGAGQSGGGAAGAAGIAEGGCTTGVPAPSGIGGILSDLGLDTSGLGGLLDILDIPANSPLRDILGQIGNILPKIPGLDPKIAGLLQTVLNNGVPDFQSIMSAVRDRLPEDAQKAFDAFLNAINQVRNPPTLANLPKNFPNGAGGANAGGAGPNGTLGVNPFNGTGAGGGAAGGTAVGNSAAANPGAATFNADAAATHASANASATPGGNCGTAVRQAIAAGGITVQPTGSAKDYGPNLEAAGFESVPASESSYVPQKGDVVVFEATEGHPHGHMQIHDGTQFVSDFKQNDPLWPSSSPNSAWKQNKPGFKVYRHPNS